jgi:hypothetical protein
MSAEAGDSPIEDYLDELVTALAGRPPRELRAMLAEAEAHLRDDAEAAVARGIAPRDAETQAVMRFGPAEAVARAERQRARPSAAQVTAQLLRGALLLVGIGAIAIGLSGVVAAAIRFVFGERALVDVTPGQVLPAADCARWRALYTSAHSCRDAAVADWAEETVIYRVVFGVLGVLVLVAYRRWLSRRGPRLPELLTIRDAVGMTAFSLAAIWTCALGFDRALNGGGAGQWFSATPIALTGAIGFAVLLARDYSRIGQP